MKKSEMKKAVKDIDELVQELPRAGAYLSFNGEIELIVKPNSQKECFTLINYEGGIEIHNIGSNEYMVLSPASSSNGATFLMRLRIDGEWENVEEKNHERGPYIKAPFQNIEYNGNVIEARLYINKESRKYKPNL